MSQLCINVAKERLRCTNSRVTERFVAANSFYIKYLHVYARMKLCYGLISRIFIHILYGKRVG